MPIYEYMCKDCGEEFEELIIGSQKTVKCRKCGSVNTDKKMSSFAFKAGATFRGTGKKAEAGGGCSGCTATSCSTCGG
jgi:putative FmdB family regulatory protein